MWIITKNGFVSIVQHESDDTMLRVRARTRQHLADTFDLDVWLDAPPIYDLGEDAPDYRWHADLPRSYVAVYVTRAVESVDYTSHVKEAVAGDDGVFYRAMLNCWSALMTLQTSKRAKRVVKRVVGRRVVEQEI